LREWSHETEKQRPNYSPEVRDRAVRLLREHLRDYPSRWATIELIAGKIGCTAPTLNTWLKQAERNAGGRAGLTSEERDRIKALEREVKELRQANEILREASAYFAQAELDRPQKK
jgi:transposase-like protein